MKKTMESVLEIAFSFLIFISLLGGGIVFLMFVMALLMGGDGGSIIATSAAEKVMPIFIKIAALAIAVGLFHTYATGSHSLSLQEERKQ